MKKLSLIILILSIFSNANSQILKKHPDNKLGLYVTLDLRNSIVEINFWYPQLLAIIKQTIICLAHFPN